MKVKSLKIAVIAGVCVAIGDVLELNDKVAKAYIEKGFVEEVAEQKSEEQAEQKSEEQAEQKSEEQAEQKSEEQAEQKSEEQAGKVKKGK